MVIFECLNNIIRNLDNYPQFHNVYKCQLKGVYVTSHFIILRDVIVNKFTQP